MDALFSYIGSYSGSRRRKFCKIVENDLKKENFDKP